MAQGNPRGRLTSWIAVLVIILGFLIGGIAMVIGPVWWLFGVGVAVVVAGAVFGAATGIMSDVH
jgi:hypothetical protein